MRKNSALFNKKREGSGLNQPNASQIDKAERAGLASLIPGVGA